MELYIAIMFLLFLSAFASKNSKVLELALLYQISLAMIVWVGLRYQVGCDWLSYERYGYYSTRYSYNDALSQRDPLFYLAIKLLNDFGIPYYPGINMIAAIIVIFGANVLGRSLRSPIYLIYYIYPVVIVGTAMSGIRQAMAIGVLMIAFSSLIQNKKYRYLIFVILASGFHGSAFLFLVFWPLIVKIPNYAKAISFVFIVVPAGYIFSGSTTVDVAIERYSATDVEAFGSYFRLGYLAVIGFAYLAYLQKQWKRRGGAIVPIMQFSSFAAIALFLLSLVRPPGVSSVIFDRLGLYLVPLIACVQIVGPSILKRRKGRDFFNAAFAGSALIFMTSWAAFSKKFDGCYVPYSSYLTQM